MIIVEHLKIKDVPILHVVQQNKCDEKLPTVIYYHGFNGEKESSLTIAYKIAEKGLRVILPDAPLHGERGNYSDEPIEHKKIYEIVLQALDELAQIKQFLEEKDFVSDGRMGLGGTSMGGMLTYAALVKYDWIKTAAILMGSPYLTRRAESIVSKDDETSEKILEKVASLDLTKNLEVLNDRPIFIWHGEKDEMVPVTDSREFYETLKDIYKDHRKIVFIEEKDRIHNISKFSIKKTAEWFKEQL